MNTPQQASLTQWCDQVGAHRIPRYDELPSIDLYMDQVVALIEEYLGLFLGQEQEKLITPAMINNYVKLKVLPAPVKKRYNRAHLCHLILICLLKQVLAIPDIRDLIQALLQTRDMKQVYDDFCLRQESAFGAALNAAQDALQAQQGAAPQADLALRVAVQANVNKIIARKMIVLRD